MTMITPSYLGETIEYSSLHACRSTLEDPTVEPRVNTVESGIHTVESSVDRAVVHDIHQHSDEHGKGRNTDSQIELKIRHLRTIVRRPAKFSQSLYTLPYMKRLVWLVIALPLIAASPEQAIRRVLDDQVAAWNRGDIPGFMEGYDKSKSTTFVGSAITKGHAEVLANYRKRYPTPAKMGTLRFSDLEVRPLGADYASVIGRFHLDRSAEAGGEASGIFTLLFQKTSKGWKVILDHTS